jgi:hypothetical protein
MDKTIGKPDLRSTRISAYSRIRGCDVLQHDCFAILLWRPSDSVSFDNSPSVVRNTLSLGS